MSYTKYFFQALRRNYQWHRERVGGVYRCETDEQLAVALADAYSKEWYVETVYAHGKQIEGGPKGELLRQARIAGLRAQEERARLRRSTR